MVEVRESLLPGISSRLVVVFFFRCDENFCLLGLFWNRGSVLSSLVTTIAEVVTMKWCHDLLSWGRYCCPSNRTQT